MLGGEGAQVVMWLVVCSLIASTRCNVRLEGNFLMTDALADGERELRIHYDGLFAKETSALANGSGIVLRQMTDGRHFIQMIMSADGQLFDCEYIQKRSAAKKFVQSFYREIDRRKRVKCGEAGRELVKCKAKANNEDDDDESFDEDSYEEAVVKPKSSRHSMYARRDQRRKRRYEQSQSLRNTTVKALEDFAEIPEDVAGWLNFDETKAMCDETHAKLKQSIEIEREIAADEAGHEGYRSSSGNGRRIRRSERQQSLVIFPGTLWCGAGQLADNYRELGPMTEADVCCRQHDHCPSRMRPMQHDNGVFNPRAYTVSHCACDRRSRRAVSVLVPGTRWCGRGNTGVQNDFGEFGPTDRCCRMHDTSCPIWIGSMESKYGLFNWRPSTIMHCRCDERFRACLKRANTDVANMVGKLFFNIVQTKCFVLKPIKGCVERSWWGKCLKMGYVKQAHLRDNMSY